MKKITRRSFLAAAGLSVAALALTACGGSSSSVASSVASSAAASSEAASTSAAAGELTTVEAGKLTMATNATFPPYEMTTDSGEFEGIDIDTAKAIADKLGVSLKIVDMSFDNLLMSLANDEFDLVIAGLTADEERRKTTDFSDPYLEAKNLILVRAEDADKYASLDDLKGVKGGAQTGSKPYNNCVTYCGEETTVGLAKVQDLVMELEAGKLDVVFLDYMTVLSYADAKEDLAAVDLGIPETSDGYSIAVKKGNTELAEFINGVLAELKEQNTIEQFIVEAKKLESAAE